MLFRSDVHRTRTIDGTRPIHSAAQCGHDKTVLLLISLRADPVPTFLTDGTTGLFTAARHGHIKVISLLFDARASTDACLITDKAIIAECGEPENYAGISPINAAADGRHLETVRLLAFVGAKLTDARGRPVTDFLHRPRDKQKFDRIIQRERTEAGDNRAKMLLEERIFDPRDD